MRKTILWNVAIIFFSFSASAEVLRCTTEEEGIYLMHKATIDSLLSLRYPEEVAKISLRYVVPLDGRERLVFYVKNREFKFICQDFLYKDSLEKRIRNKMTIDKVYQDSINTVLIPEYRNHLSGENLCYALHCRKILDLDSTQYSYIMAKAISMARRINKDYRVNLWSDEMDILKKTLDRHQLRSFFITKNAAKVTKEFDKAWAKLVHSGLTEQLDSVKDARDALNYLFSKQMIKDLYRYNGNLQKKNLAELDKSRPKMIRMLEAIDKRERIEEKTKAISKEYIW